jgi:hypothetical protein
VNKERERGENGSVDVLGPSRSIDGDQSTVIKATPAEKTSAENQLVDWNETENATTKRTKNEPEVKKVKKKAKTARNGNRHAGNAPRFVQTETSEETAKWKSELLDVRRKEMKLEELRWRVQEKESLLKTRQQQLQYNFDLMIKYKELQKGGFDNHQILEMIPDMRPIIDKSNMPVNLQLSAGQASD